MSTPTEINNCLNRCLAVTNDKSCTPPLRKLMEAMIEELRDGNVVDWSNRCDVNGKLFGGIMNEMKIGAMLRVVSDAEKGYALAEKCIQQLKHKLGELDEVAEPSETLMYWVVEERHAAYRELLQELVAQPPEKLAGCISTNKWTTLLSINKLDGPLLKLKPSDFVASEKSLLVAWYRERHYDAEKIDALSKSDTDAKNWAICFERNRRIAAGLPPPPLWECDDKTPADRMQMITDHLSTDDRDGVSGYRGLFDGGVPRSERDEKLGRMIPEVDGVPVIDGVDQETMQKFVNGKAGGDLVVLPLSIVRNCIRADPYGEKANSCITITPHVTNLLHVSIVCSSGHEILDLKATAKRMGDVKEHMWFIDKSLFGNGELPVPMSAAPGLLDELNSAVYVEARIGSIGACPKGERVRIESYRVPLTNAAFGYPCKVMHENDPEDPMTNRVVSHAAVAFRVVREIKTETGWRVGSSGYHSSIKFSVEMHLSFGRKRWDGVAHVSLLGSMKCEVSGSPGCDDLFDITDGDVASILRPCDDDTTKSKLKQVAFVPHVPAALRNELSPTSVKELSLQQVPRDSPFVPSSIPPFATHTGLAFPHVRAARRSDCDNILLTGIDVVVEFTASWNDQDVHEDAILKALGQTNRDDGELPFAFDVVRFAGNNSNDVVSSACGKNSWESGVMKGGTLRLYFRFDSHDFKRLRGVVCAFRVRCTSELPGAGSIVGQSDPFMLFQSQYASVDGAVLGVACATSQTGVRQLAPICVFNNPNDLSGTTVQRALDPRREPRYSDVDMAEVLQGESAKRAKLEAALRGESAKRAKLEEKLRHVYGKLNENRSAYDKMDFTKELEENAQYLQPRVANEPDASSDAVMEDGHPTTDTVCAVKQATTSPSFYLKVAFIGEHKIGGLKLIQTFDYNLLLKHAVSMAVARGETPPSVLTFNMFLVTADDHEPVETSGAEAGLSLGAGGPKFTLTGTFESFRTARFTCVVMKGKLLKIAIAPIQEMRDLLDTAYSDSFKIMARPRGASKVAKAATAIVAVADTPQQHHTSSIRASISSGSASATSSTAASSVARIAA